MNNIHAPDYINRYGSVDDILDRELVERVVRNCHRGHKPRPRWAHISDAFALGSTYSAQLCRRYGLNPDEIVPTRK